MGWSGAACSQKMHNAVPTRGRNSVQHLDAATKAGTACCPQPGPRPYLAPSNCHPTYHSATSILGRVWSCLA